ncbi:tubulin beta chain-like [Polyergus mexicanus]|uniref:tubulin beta chain-like n=1 Tax=Polyergus mexicanus TaxID=615972 RepID=UPI0038B43985
MREIVHVQIGRCGNRIGKMFWKVIAAEHGLDQCGRYKPNTSELQKQRIDVYFAEGADERYVPRAVLLDFDCKNMHYVLSNSLFKPDNVVCGKSAINNNWAKGHYTEGADILEEALKIVRTEVEACDSVQVLLHRAIFLLSKLVKKINNYIYIINKGIQIVHAVGGGAGSGFGSLFALYMMEEYPNKILKSYTLMPSSEDNIVTQPYNAVLTIPYLIDCIQEVFCISNDAISRICSDKLKIVTNKEFYPEINHVISLCMSGITACLRFPGQLNAGLRKLLVNMVPFPRLHFFVPGYVPLQPGYKFARRKGKVRTLIQDMFKSESMFINCDPRNGQFLTAAAIFRGRISTKEVDESIHLLQNQYSSHYVEWIPHNIKTAICDIATYNTNISATSLSNTTAIQDVFKTLLDQFQEMFTRKAYLHSYINEGMEESDFLEAQNSLSSLISEYQQYQSAEAKTTFVEEFIPYVED